LELITKSCPVRIKSFAGILMAKPGTKHLEALAGPLCQSIEQQLRNQSGKNPEPKRATEMGETI